MVMKDELKKYIDNSILCWLATTDANGNPNVSPKEVFTYYDEEIVIANIASPNSVKNILANDIISLSFVDVFVQKGYKIKGRATLINRENSDFVRFNEKLKILAGEGLPFDQIIKIKVVQIEAIIAPRYKFFPGTTEEDQIKSALKAYGVERYFNRNENDYVVNYLESVVKQFKYYKQLGERTFEQLKDIELFTKESDSENSIANIVFHLHGNMMSRWTDFLTSDGEKDFRDRDNEFEDVLSNRDEMLKVWNEGWDCLFAAMETISTDNFHNIVYIRNMGHSITEAINRQLAHYSYHVGQIVLLGKDHKKDEWTSLTIPKGASKEYNEKKFGQERRREHFTDGFISEKQKRKK